MTMQETIIEALKLGATIPELVKETKLSRLDIVTEITEMKAKMQVYITDWELSKEGYTWIPVYYYGIGANKPFPKEVKIKRDYSVKMLFGNDNAEPVHHYGVVR